MSGFTPYSHRDFIKQLRQLLQDRHTWDGDGSSILNDLIQNAKDPGTTQTGLGWVPATGICEVHPLAVAAVLLAIANAPIAWSDVQNRHYCGRGERRKTAATFSRRAKFRLTTLEFNGSKLNGCAQ